MGRPKFDCHVGAGLWLQWPTPFAPAPAAWTSYAGFVGYEAALRRAAGQYARDAPGATVVASTTHSQCDAAFTRDFRRVADEARRRGRVAASAGCAALGLDDLVEGAKAPIQAAFDAKVLELANRGIRSLAVARHDEGDAKSRLPLPFLLPLDGKLRRCFCLDKEVSASRKRRDRILLQ